VIGLATVGVLAAACGGASSPSPADAGPTDSIACVSDADCADLGAIGVCEDAVCLEGVCTTTPRTGGACDDNNACTFDTVCTDGVCAGGDEIVCVDGDKCTDDGCHPSIGCVFGPNADPCDDGNACTGEDRCSSTGCQGTTGVNCNDNNECTDDGCDSASGCTHDLTQFFKSGSFYHEGPCNDGNPCTDAGTCADGQCVGGTPVVCDDEDVCTDDTCEDGVGCVGTPNTAPCDDGDQCTENDLCAEGQCAGVTGLSCDDFDSCTDDACDSAAGCSHTHNTANCNDNDECTTGDTCLDGACLGGEALACDDGNPCTDDSCDVSLGCVTTNNSTACDDDNLCTTGDTCADGSCQAGAVVECDDGEDCTSDDCVPSIGCVITGQEPDFTACEDNLIDTHNPICVSGACLGATQHTFYPVSGDACALSSPESVALYSQGDTDSAVFTFQFPDATCTFSSRAASWTLNAGAAPALKQVGAGQPRAAHTGVVVGDEGFLALDMGWTFQFDPSVKQAAQDLAPDDIVHYRDVGYAGLGSGDEAHYLIVGRNQSAGTGYMAHCHEDLGGNWLCEQATDDLVSPSHDLATVQMFSGPPPTCGDPCTEPYGIDAVWVASNGPNGTSEIYHSTDTTTYSLVTTLTLGADTIIQSFAADQSVWFITSGDRLARCSHAGVAECTVLLDGIPNQVSFDFTAGWAHKGTVVLLGHQVTDGYTGPVLVALPPTGTATNPQDWVLRPLAEGTSSTDRLTDGMTATAGGFYISGNAGDGSQANIWYYPAPAP